MSVAHIHDRSYPLFVLMLTAHHIFPNNLLLIFVHAGRFRFGDDEARVMGVDSDGTPTDDASSVSSSDTRRRTPTRLLPRHSNINAAADGNYATSSPSDSEGNN